MAARVCPAEHVATWDEATRTLALWCGDPGDPESTELGVLSHARENVDDPRVLNKLFTDVTLTRHELDLTQAKLAALAAPEDLAVAITVTIPLHHADCPATNDEPGTCNCGEDDVRDYPQGGLARLVEEALKRHADAVRSSRRPT